MRKFYFYYEMCLTNLQSLFLVSFKFHNVKFFYMLPVDIFFLNKFNYDKKIDSSPALTPVYYMHLLSQQHSFHFSLCCINYDIVNVIKNIKT